MSSNRRLCGHGLSRRARGYAGRKRSGLGALEKDLRRSAFLASCAALGNLHRNGLGSTRTLAAQWLTDVEGLDRTAVVLLLFAMSIALSLGAILIGLAADRLRRRGVGPEVLLGLVATVFITAQLALILRWPLPSYFLRAVVGGGRCGNRAQLCDFGRIFSQRAHRAGQRGAESVPHRCSVRCAIRDRLRASALDASSGALSRNRVLDSLCFQSRPPDRGVGLVRASASPNALAAANAHAIQRSRFDPDGPLRPIHQ